MFKAYAPQFIKPHTTENDSVEELETLQTEDGGIPKSIPESCTMTKNLFMTKAQHFDSPPRSKSRSSNTNSPNPLQVRSQSQEHKDHYSSGHHHQAHQIQHYFEPTSVTHFPSQTKNSPANSSTVVHKENATRPREYSFNPNGHDYDDGNSHYTELAHKIFNEKYSSKPFHTMEADAGSAMVKQLAGCTFTPNVHSTKGQRNLNQFLEDQNKHLSRVEAKKKKIAEEQLHEKMKERSHRPEICQKSIKILEKKKQYEAPAYQRLYNSSKKPNANAEADNYDFTDSEKFAAAVNDCETIQGQGLQRKNSKSDIACKFRPEIQKKSKNLKRDDKVDNLLYNDALRRQNKFNEVPKATKPKSTSVAMSSTSKKAIATRFIKEFDIVIEEFFALKKQSFNYVQLNELLNRLCFMKDTDNIEDPRFAIERGLLYDSWYILNANKYKGIHRRNLLVFLLAVLNLHFPITKIIKDEHDGRESPYENGQDRSHNPLLTEENEPLSKSLNQSFHPLLPEGLGPREKISIGIFDEEGNYELTEEEVKELHNLFEPWYINRLCAGDNLGQFVAKKTHDEPTFHPEINHASKDLATNYREKMLTGTAELIQQNKVAMPKDGKLTHADLLIVSKKVAEEKVNKYGELIKEEQTRDLTFKPQISQYTPSKNDAERRSVYKSKEKPMTPEPLGKDRVYELHSLGRPRLLKEDKSPLQRDYEKNYQECTFQPNTHLKRDRQTNTNNSSNFFAKGIDKSIERIRNARADKEQQVSASKNSREAYDGHFVTSMDRSIRNTSKDKTPRKEGRSKSPISNLRDTPSQLRDTSMNRSNSQANVKRESIEGNRGPYLFHEQKKQNYEGFDYNMGGTYEANKNFGFTHETAAYGANKDFGFPHETAGHSYHGYTEEPPKMGPTHEIAPFLQDKMDEHEDERVPLLFVDVNLGLGKAERITVFEGDTAEGLAQKFSEEYGLEPLMKSKLKELLDAQIAGLLSRIEEELHSGYSDTDRHYKHQY